MINHRSNARALARRQRVVTFCSSCRPFAVQSFLGSRLQLRALCDISVGDEITISYIDGADTHAERQRKLRVHAPSSMHTTPHTTLLTLTRGTTVSSASAAAAPPPSQTLRCGALRASHAVKS